MKYPAILMALSLGLQAAPCWVQVISVHDPASITPAFLEQAAMAPQGYEQIDAEPWHKVRIGPFEDEAAARRALPRIRCAVAPDAFVTQEAVPQKSSEEAASESEAIETASQHACHCVYDKRTTRMREIAAILEFYKRDEATTFTP